MEQLFAVNPFIGCGLTGPGDFPTPEALLEHLDYLGIDRCLVASLEARDYAPACGNRELLEALAPYRERLLPCLILTPSACYEDGEIEFFRAQMAAGNRAFRLCLKEMEFQMRDLERAIAQLADLRPVLFFDTPYNSNYLDMHDTADLAARYPAVTFVCTQQMWGRFQTTLDLMWRCPNVLLDISWLHMNDTIELVIRDFGEERMVFGIGTSSQYGAAIAALAHARITDEQRAKIAHGNLERVLGIPPLNRRLAHEPALLEQKPLWRRFREGKSIKDLVPGEVVDIHAHTGSFTGGWCIPNYSAPLPEQFRHFVEFMDRHGVSRVIDANARTLFDDPVRWNRVAEEHAAAHPGRFSGWFGFNVHYAHAISEEVLDDFFRRGYFVGIKLLPSYQGVPVTDPRYRVVWEYADQHRLPVLCHTWGDRYDAPRLFRDILPNYPNLRLIIGHSGGSELQDRLDAEELLRQFPNVYLDSCATFCCPRPWQEAIRQFGNTRFLFGSDAGGHNEAYELGLLLSLPLPDQQLMPILGENWRRLQAEVKY